MKNIKIISLSLLVTAVGTVYSTIEYGTTSMWLQEKAMQPQQEVTGWGAETIQQREEATKKRDEAKLRQKNTLQQMIQAQLEGFQQEQAQRAAATARLNAQGNANAEDSTADAKTQDSTWINEGLYEILN